jgi:hypothetical protein
MEHHSIALVVTILDWAFNVRQDTCRSACVHCASEGTRNKSAAVLEHYITRIKNLEVTSPYKQRLESALESSLWLCCLPIGKLVERSFAMLGHRESDIVHVE